MRQLIALLGTLKDASAQALEKALEVGKQGFWLGAQRDLFQRLTRQSIDEKEMTLSTSATSTTM